jgi:hypothetical protein
MSDPSRSVEEYLTRLSEALDVLGKDEAAEIVAEIRGHLGDAIAERDGNAEEVLAEFGTPDALATRILEERGILAGSPSLAAAPKPARFVALLLDIAVWLLAVYAALVPVAVVPFLKYVSDLHMLAAIAAYAWLVAVVGASIWWWTKGRGRPGRSTVGMRLLGLRRVRIGHSVLTVRLADIPGASPPSRLAPALVVGFALLVVVPGLLSVSAIYGASQQEDKAAVVSDVSSAASVVGELYRQVESGASLNDTTSNCAPSARSGVSALISRHAAGQLNGYVVSRLELVQYKGDPFFPPRPAQPAGAVVSEVVVRVHVFEYAKNTDAGQAYVAQVHERMVSDGGSGGGYSASGSTLVESIARDTEQ